LGEKFGHYKIGCYMRIELKVDKGISRKIEPEYPVVLCSLKQHELGFAFVRVKIKKHRWFPHVLKTKDPIVFSVGWRKF
jgi:ribosome biogenesis protein BMS1